MKKLSIDDAARVFHETLRTYRIATGDRVLPSWDETTEENRDTGREFVQVVVDDPSISPETHHERWVAWRFYRGWRWGEVYDAEAKVNPSMCPFRDLPIHKRTEAEMMVALVKSLLPMIEKKNGAGCSRFAGGRFFGVTESAIRIDTVHVHG